MNAQAANDVERRRANILWFDQPIEGAEGRPLTIPENVAPINDVIQWFDLAEEPIRISSGRPCVVVGVSSENSKELWLDIDSHGPFVGANILLSAKLLRVIK